MLIMEDDWSRTRAIKICTATVPTRSVSCMSVCNVKYADQCEVITREWRLSVSSVSNHLGVGPSPGGVMTAVY